MNNTAYFLSDVHLRIQIDDVERERRKELFLLMDKIKAEKATLFIVGDWFDFYFEYGYVVSQAYLDVYAKMKELVDAGISIYYFGGNHDYWIGPFLSKTIGVKIYPKAATIEFAGKQFYFNHGDGLDPEDVGYHRLRSVINTPSLSGRLDGSSTPTLPIGSQTRFPEAVGKNIAKRLQFTS